MGFDTDVNGSVLWEVTFGQAKDKSCVIYITIGTGVGAGIYIEGKLLVSFFVIMLFVTGGYEHCVANMYYITAGLFAKLNPSYVQMAME